MKPKEIYLAIWYDRHTDDQYKAFRTLEDAIAQCNAWAKTYEYEFSKPDWDYESFLEYLIETKSDDGPRLSVKKIELA